MVEASKHPNIKLYTYTEIKKVAGGPGEFVVTLLKKPRYVDETKCTG
jgi:heterodisulfide reductase subunit A